MIAITDFMDSNIIKSSNVLSFLIERTKHMPNIWCSIKIHKTKVNYHLGKWDEVLKEDNVFIKPADSSQLTISSVMRTFFRILICISRGNFDDSNLESTRLHNKYSHINNIPTKIHTKIALGMARMYSGDDSAKRHLTDAWKMAVGTTDKGLIISTALNSSKLSLIEGSQLFAMF